MQSASQQPLPVRFLLFESARSACFAFNLIFRFHIGGMWLGGLCAERVSMGLAWAVYSYKGAAIVEWISYADGLMGFWCVEPR